MSNEEIDSQVEATGTRKSIQIINERPEGMSFEDYKSFRRIQDKMIKKYRKGKMVWLSKLEPTPMVLAQLTQDNMMGTIGNLIKKGESFVGSVKDLK